MTRSRHVFAVFFGSIALAVSGACGGGAGDACGQVQPCGGDVVGTWKLSSACATEPPVPAKLCAAATVQHSHYDVSGTATFGADLGYSISATQSGTVEVAVPAACLMNGNVTLSCAQITPPVPGGVNVQCLESNDGCLCTFVILSHDVRETGTYVTNGSMLMDTPAGAPVDSVAYCVAGNRLHVISLDPTMTSASGAPVIGGDLVGGFVGGFVGASVGPKT